LGQEDGITEVSPDFEDFGKEVICRAEAYKNFLRVFDNRGEINFLNLDIPCGDRDFMRRLVKTGTHYFPRRQGRKAALST
jgi:hypothetical protein